MRDRRSEARGRKGCLGSSSSSYSNSSSMGRPTEDTESAEKDRREVVKVAAGRIGGRDCIPADLIRQGGQE